MKNFFIFFFVSMSMLCISLVGSAQDVEILENYKVKMPDLKPLPQEEFEKKSVLYEANPPEKDKFSFSLRIPKDWSITLDPNVAKKTAAATVIGDLARFYSPSRYHARSYITIEATELDHEISIEHWVLKYMVSRGLPSKGFEVLSDTRAQFFYVDVEGDTTFAIRAVAQRSGKNILLAKYAMPSQTANKESGLQASVLKSFKAKYEEPAAVEKLSEYRFLDVASIKYPISWVLRAPRMRSMDRMKVKILNFNENGPSYALQKSLDGKMEVYLTYFFAVKDLGQEKNRIIEESISQGLTVGEEIDVSEYDISEDLKPLLPDLESYEIKGYNVSSKTGKLLRYEFWMTTLEVADYYYTFTLLTPSRDEDFFTWSRNIESYEVTVKTLEPNLDLIIYDD